MTNLHPADLGTLAQLIENQRCALVLGPHASTDAAGRPLRQLLAEHIAEAFFKKTGRRIAEPDNLALTGTTFLQEPDTPRLSLEILVRDFYKKHTEPADLLREAARLPFPLILTVSPDGLLQRAFLTEKKRQFREGVYRFSKTQTDDFDQMPAGQTYLYQLFGKLDTSGNCDSMVLCLDDQLKYIDSVQGVGRETRLPASLRSAMQDFEAFLFIGFDYENWYLKVLFHILKISASEKTKLIFGLPDGLSRNLSAGAEAFFRQQYRFKFFKNEALDLLRDLRARLESDENDAPPNDGKPPRTLLFLHAAADKSLAEKLDRQLAQVKRQHGLASKSIHDFVGGDTETVQNQLIDEAAVIVPILSADLLADDVLFEKLTRRALSRQSGSICVASVYAREVGGGVAELFKNQIVLPAHTVPLTWMDENTGLSKIAENLEKLIAVLK